MKNNGFTRLFHCNTRSLNKNHETLKDILDAFKDKPNVIAISETKLKDENIHNISIPGYKFVGTNSRSNAGDVELYINEKINFI